MTTTDLRKEIPLLSVVVPTRNRFQYIKSSILSVLQIPSTQVEVVVEDNSQDDELQNWIGAQEKDVRLVYRHSSIPVSMTENYDRAMQLVSGEYVCLIGDDDGVNPEILDATRWAKANGLDALVPIDRVHFVWPDLHLPRAGAIAPGELRITPFSCAISFPNAEEEMKKCAHDAGQEFHHLPRCYYGIVRKECWDRVQKRTGTFFPGVSPDMAAALAISNYVQKICVIDYPLFVPGSSRNSNAGLAGLGKHIGKLKDQLHLPPNVEENWSEIVPPFFSGETIWAEAAVSALQSTGRQDFLREFNVPRLYADLVMWHPSYSLQVMKRFYGALHLIGRNPLLGTWQFVHRFLFLSSLRADSLVSRFFRRPVQSNNRIGVKGLNNIQDAVNALTDYLRSNGVSFHQSLGQAVGARHYAEPDIKSNSKVVDQSSKRVS